MAVAAAVAAARLPGLRAQSLRWNYSAAIDLAAAAHLFSNCFYSLGLRPRRRRSLMESRCSEDCLLLGVVKLREDRGPLAGTSHARRLLVFPPKYIFI